MGKGGGGREREGSGKKKGKIRKEDEAEWGEIKRKHREPKERVDREWREERVSE